MKKLSHKHKNTILMLLLMLLIFSWPITAQAAQNKPSDAQKVKGGYLLSEQAMRDTVAGWQADHEAVKILRQSLDALQKEIQLQAEDTRRQLDELQNGLESERKRYNAAVRKSRRQGLLIGIIIGVTTGALVNN